VNIRQGSQSGYRYLLTPKPRNFKPGRVIEMTTTPALLDASGALAAQRASTNTLHLTNRGSSRMAFLRNPNRGSNWTDFEGGSFAEMTYRDILDI
jgi:hypothetical protein